MGYLTDLCQAEDHKLTAMGVFRSPNWEARKNGLDRVLDLLRYRRKDAPSSGEGMPAKIIFNVVNPTMEIKKAAP